MTLLYTDPRFLWHETGRHPENPRRLQAVVDHLDRIGLLQACAAVEPPEATVEQLLLVHHREYIHRVELFARQGGGQIEADTVVSPRSFDVARLAVGVACDAVERVLAGQAPSALCLVRPPGHHALPADAMGFCLFNNVAIAARWALRRGAERVLIVDWDVHHGNGTQEVFWNDPQVGFFSIHRFPFYPGTGRAEETGGPQAPGTICNVHVAYGTPRNQYLELFQTRLTELAQRIRPQLILISAGFDAHRADPIGSLDLEAEDFARMTQVALQLARQFAQGRVVSLLEGGYHPQALAQCVEVHLRELLQATTPTPEGEENHAQPPENASPER